MSPQTLKEQLSPDKQQTENLLAAREAVRKILNGEDHRFLVIIGPCSIHDIDQALDYANKLKELSVELEDTLLLVMRVYFEKPRTTVGWKGFINDPNLDDSFDIGRGLYKARSLLLELATMGLPAANEALDPIVPQYLGDLVSWTAIGARTAESQTHREIASGLSAAVGFKNGTDGSLAVAINALQSVSKPHRFLGINADGKAVVIETNGNAFAHIVLRGGESGPNYDSKSIEHCEQALNHANVSHNIMVDCSHANSSKDHMLQPMVAKSVARQICTGNQSIIGLMLESNLKAGRQSIPEDRSKLSYGVSVTDGCISWEQSANLLRELREQLSGPLATRWQRLDSLKAVA